MAAASPAAMPPPTGANPTSDLQNGGIAIEIIFPALALIVTCLRVHLRLKTKNFGWDDALIIVAMLLSLALAVGSIMVMKLLFVGIHYWDVPMADAMANLPKGLMWIYIVGLVYNPILAVVKQSVLVLLLRVAGDGKPYLRTAVWVMAVFNAAEMVAVFLVVLFQCSPIEANWNVALLAPGGGGKCIDQIAFGLSTAILTIVTDLCVLALPIYIFFDLQINKRTKLALIFVFMLGFGVTIVSVVRLYFFEQHLTDTRPDANFSLGFCVSAIECNLAIITACMPALWPMLRNWLPRVFSRMGISTGDYHKGGRRKGSGYEDIERTPDASGGVRSGDASAGGGGGSANKTITSASGSNGSFQLEKLRGDRAEGRTNIHADGRREDSDEEALTHLPEGIMRTTDYIVTKDQVAAGRKPE